MSSVSSFEGCEKDNFLQKNVIDGTSSARHSYLRKADFLDGLDVGRRDTDAWSVAATIDDQESVISNHGGPPSISSRMCIDREMDDDRSTLDGESLNLHDMRLSSTQASHNRIESLRDLVHHNHLLRNGSIDDEEDKRSRSNAAEFGDDGVRSATTDFDQSVASDDDHHNVVDDQIMAPPQPQPSFASVNKSYTELMEENEILQSQLRDAQMAQKHQDVLISNLRHLTNCDEALFGKALDLSQQKISGEEEEEEHLKSNKGNRKSELYFGSPMQQETPIINARTLAHRLAQLGEEINHFVEVSVGPEWRNTIEQSLYVHITASYLTSLPFGTENQDLLNTAYSDQISRFHNTLGANFAKWYRRQTVQSLSLNHATKEYLQHMRAHLTEEMVRLITSVPSNGEYLNQMHIWEDILDLCAALSLEIHGGDADVCTQTVTVGSKFDPRVMAAIGDYTDTHEKVVNMVISPLFIDEEDNVLLPARVILQ